MKDILTILLIEDDACACRELKEYFATCNDLNLVETTNDSNTGLKLVRAYLPNVVLLDLELHHGGGNGLMFLNELKKLPLSHIPYITLQHTT